MKNYTMPSFIPRGWRNKPNRGKAAMALGSLIRLLLLLGLSYIILFPFLTKLSSVFMSMSDTYDDTVQFIPRSPTLDNIRFVFEELEFLPALWNTLLLSTLVAVCSACAASVIGYGLARFSFRGSKIILVLVVATILIPLQTTMITMYSSFRYFDFFGIARLLVGHPIKLTDTFFPQLYLAITGLGFRGGLYILIMRQYFRDIPQELSEAAWIDGAGTARTYWAVMVPLSKAMMIVVFLLSFAWQWTDTYYSGLLYSSFKQLPNIVMQVSAITPGVERSAYYISLLTNTTLLMAIFPLIILYVFTQKLLVQGIERSGIIG